jgi:predicted nucleic acid-binding protein
MTVIVDTGVLYADHDTDASRHEAATRAVEAIYDGEFGQPYVSDYIYDEAVTLTLKRSDVEAAKLLRKRIRGVDSYPTTYEMCSISAAVFADAVSIFERYDDQQLSFTDASTVALCERHAIDAVVSFDDDFDGVVDRIEPRSL